MTRQRIIVGVGAVVVVVAVGAGIVFARSGDSKSAAPIVAPGTTTTPVPPPTYPLTGLAITDKKAAELPLLTVKIDNHPDARSQYGIDKADVIVEEKVEGGTSRFMALFQSQESDRLGPVRSLRSTDPVWLKPEGGMIAYSGGINAVKALLAPNGITDLGADTHGATYYKRRSDRPSPHDYVVNTNTLRSLTPKGAPTAKPLFTYLKAGEAFGGSTAAPITTINGKMLDTGTSTAYAWTWDAGASMFARATDGRPHMIENVGQIKMTNVILQFLPYRLTPWRDPANAPVDEAVSVGSGDAWVLSDGKIVKGHWSRPSVDDITTYTDANGAPIALEPGRTWLQLIPTGTATNVQ